jgi:hypothetical protein
LVYFQKKKQEEDSKFFYAIDKNESDAAQHVFWVDGRVRRAYLEFRYIVMFNTTYNNNSYMPLAPLLVLTIIDTFFLVWLFLEPKRQKIYLVIQNLVESIQMQSLRIKIPP